MLVTATLVFSKNNKIGSKFISWLCCHQNHFYKVIPTPSHVALVLQNRWVFEAVIGKGVIVQSLGQWQEKNQICHFVDLGVYEYQEIADHFRAIKGKRYDYLGAFYLGLCILLNKLIKTPIPQKNILECHDCYFCSEAIGKIIKKDLSMTSPAHLLSTIPDWLTPLRKRGMYD